MKTKAICSFFVLFAIVAGIGTITPAAFAEVTITPDPGSGEPTDDCIDVEYGCYTPGTATVDVGGKIIFSNTDSAAHTFTSGAVSDDIVGLVFGDKMMMSGDSFEWTPDTVGEFPYFCMIHPWMDGLIIVQEAEAEEEIVEPVEEEIMEETVEEEIMEETVEEEIMEEETMMEETEVMEEEEGGGCLIATATFGSELAPQVQQLIELERFHILTSLALNQCLHNLV